MKTIVILILVSIVFVKSNGQDAVVLPKEADSLPREQMTGEFIDRLNREFLRLSRKKPDSLLLLYKGPDYGITVDALIIYKKKGISKVFSIEQYNSPNGKVATITLRNDNLRNAGIYNLFQLLQNDHVRSIDTNGFISHNEILYSQFYFGNIHKIYVGFIGRVFASADPDLYRGYVEESNKRIYRIRKKRKEPETPYISN